MQRKIRDIKPFPVCVVYWQQQNHTLEDVKRNFEMIKELGFTGLKQICLKPDGSLSMEEVQLIALDMGLIPWFYGEAGWLPIDDELLMKLGISKELNMEEVQRHPAMLKHQEEFYRRRILREKEYHRDEVIRLGEPATSRLPMPEYLIPLFSRWLEDKYGSIDNLKKAWNCDVFGEAGLNSFEEAARIAVDSKIVQRRLVHSDFRRYRDAMRFMADIHVDDIRRALQQKLEFDPEEPQRTGGHQLFENQALNGWDLEAQAQAVREAGSFYCSIHIAHHLNEVDGEVDRPVYMQSRMIKDFFKGGWAAVWESTGGPAVYSGHKPAGVNAGIITRLMLTYIAAGLKGIGIWSWDARDVGWELGEYALTNLIGEPSDRAIAAGEIAQAIQKYRFELWESHNCPMVGILYSWENEAAFARLSMGGYPVKQLEGVALYPSCARIGISRSLINCNVPFEYVTQKDLEARLAGRYKIIYMPSILSLPIGIIELLGEYVEKGGRLVVDMPCLMMDDYGRLFDTNKGSMFENIFGLSILSYQHTNNIPLFLEGMKLKGQFADVKITKADVVSTFHNGEPAITECRVGKGSAVFIAFEASSMCYRQGNHEMERVLTNVVLGECKPEWYCDMPMVYCLSAPKADHYFFINDGEKRRATLRTNTKYLKGEDVITGEKILVSGQYIQVRIPAYSGCWVRLLK